MDKNAWTRYLEVTTHPDNDKTIAFKVGVSPSTIGRWRSGEIDPKPRQVVALARRYGKSPLAALVAAEYLSAEDLEEDLTLHYAADLDEISTLQLVDELRDRLEVMNDYAGWLASITRETGHPAHLAHGALRYVHPAVAPSQVDGMDFIRPIASHLHVEELDGDKYYSIDRPHDVSVSDLPPHVRERIQETSAARTANVDGTRQDYDLVANDSINEFPSGNDADYDHA
ncbi:MAG: helix-turn-helix transcriptional regulator [Candidatus Microbacterium colombiense]|nr:MAG: helix-turn-helix transcriptional regulator [Microbacterium sp.]